MSHLMEGVLLILLSVFVHATGTLVLLRLMDAYRPWWEKHGGVGLNTLSLTWIVVTLVLLHIFEVGIYALFYLWEGVLPDLDTAAYFSLATYTTVGYGDVVLDKEWRLFGASEALVGILMTAWSTGILINIVSTVHHKTLERWRERAGTKRSKASGRSTK